MTGFHVSVLYDTSIRISCPNNGAPFNIDMVYSNCDRFLQDIPSDHTVWLCRWSFHFLQHEGATGCQLQFLEARCHVLGSKLLAWKWLQKMNYCKTCMSMWYYFFFNFQEGKIKNGILNYLCWYGVADLCRTGKTPK